MGIKELNFKREIQRLSPIGRHIVTAALLGLLAISLGCLVEDYSTSYYGLSLIPGQLANDWIRFLLAAAPSLLQVVFAFVAVTQRNRLAGGIMVLAWLFDMSTDIAFKLQGLDPTPGNMLVVAVYALFVASFFSEIMLMFALQHLAYALGPALRDWWTGVREVVSQARQATAGGLMDDAQRMMFPADDDLDLSDNAVHKVWERQNGRS